MTTLASAVLSKAAIILQDVTNVRWAISELLGWLNDGQQEIVLLLPEACTKTQTVVLSPGTRQALPTDGIRLIAITRNMGNAGNTPGRAVRVIDRAVLDAQLPNWHTDSASQTTMHYAFDSRNPKSFYVYPPQPSPAGHVEMVYSFSPTAVANTDPITLDDIYVNALLDFILYRAYLKDAEYTQNAQRAQIHYETFLKSLGMKEPSDQSVEPVMGSSRPTLTIPSR